MNNYTKNPFYKFLSKETKEHVHLVQWLEWTKPGLWFHYPGEGKKTPFERYVWALMGGKKSVPDFIFLERRGKYNGLAVELKATGTKIYRDDGKPLSTMVPQWEFLQKLKERGWMAEFASGQDEAKKIIEQYFKL